MNGGDKFEHLRPISPIFDLDYTPPASREVGQSKIKALGFLIVILLILICVFAGFVLYCYHKSAGELLKHHHDPYGKKPFDMDEKEREHLESMGARDKEVGDDYDEEHDDSL